MENKIWFVSWSSGKDSCLALYEALKEKKKVNFLLNFAIDGKVHGINREIIETQAEAIGIPLIQKITTWENYEKNFDEEVLKLKEKGITGIIAGDIDLEEHLEWIKRKSKELCIDYYEPLWKRKREEILNEFVSDGFQAVVVCCIEKAKFLIGKEINKFTIEDFIKDTKENGIDSCGENGEFHTLVIDGPIFNKRLEIIESYEKEINEVRYGKKFILDIKKWKLKRKK
jgi:diphthine-ammonia ligase